MDPKVGYNSLIVGGGGSEFKGPSALNDIPYSPFFMLSKKIPIESMEGKCKTFATKPVVLKSSSYLGGPFSQVEIWILKFATR